MVQLPRARHPPLVRYFGYGSNLDLVDLRRWCREHGHTMAGIRPVGPAWLPDAEVVFHYRSRARRGGALSVRSRVGSAVPGGLFEVDEAGWATLEAKEGARYERVPRVVLRAGEEIEAQTFVVREEHREEGHVAPTDAYVGHVTRGLEAQGLPTAQVRAAARALDPEPLPRAIFVYGTLMRGQSRAPVLSRRARSRRAARTSGALVDLRDYPGLVAGDGVVHGELVELTDPTDVIPELDGHEGFHGYGHAGSLYRRTVVEVHAAEGSSHAWTYRYLGKRDAPRIAGGLWSAHGRVDDGASEPA